jgi:hypothetical protein
MDRMFGNARNLNQPIASSDVASLTNTVYIGFATQQRSNSRFIPGTSLLWLITIPQKISTSQLTPETSLL